MECISELQMPGRRINSWIRITIVNPEGLDYDINFAYYFFCQATLPHWSSLLKEQLNIAPKRWVLIQLYKYSPFNTTKFNHNYKPRRGKLIVENWNNNESNPEGVTLSKSFKSGLFFRDGS